MVRLGFGTNLNGLLDVWDWRLGWRLSWVGRMNCRCSWRAATSNPWGNSFVLQNKKKRGRWKNVHVLYFCRQVYILGAFTKLSAGYNACYSDPNINRNISKNSNWEIIWNSKIENFEKKCFDLGHCNNFVFVVVIPLIYMHKMRGTKKLPFFRVFVFFFFKLSIYYRKVSVT